jgi:DNA-binding NarL/FixJ family response regulator
MDVSIGLLLIENQPLTRLGVRAVVAEQNDIDLVGEADNLADGFAMFLFHR